jgi:patatin-like phospholipase/acyl hydrolase
VLTLEILAEMERQIQDATGVAKLGDFFDYIAGTSTGSIIAAGLAVGMSAAELLDFYEKFGAKMFEKSSVLERVTSLFSNLYEDEGKPENGLNKRQASVRSRATRCGD